MKKRVNICLLFIICACLVIAQEKEVKIRLIETSDLHGNFFPFNLITRKPSQGSLARIHSLVEMRREQFKDNLVLIDNGDILQGQPTVYYYNYIDTTSVHLCAEMMNYMRYDIGNVGNHDFETGRPVFERWVGDCNFPILGANVIDETTGKPFLTPYIIIERQGVKIAVLGLVTPAIPVWLPEKLWEGLSFEDMEKSARKWIKVIQEKEKPDAVVGVFHSGQYESLLGRKYKDNASLSVARNVPGFDVILMGHDHLRECKKIVSNNDETILLVNPANNGMVVAEVDMIFKLRDGSVYEKTISGALTSVDQYNPSAQFMERFSSQYHTLEAFFSKKIGSFEKTLSTREAYFGPSPFVDFIHFLQLEITGAEISFAAPLAFDTEIRSGDVRVSDMFALYQFENLLYTMRLTGKEIKNHLEMSYDMWADRMKSPDDHLLKFKEANKKKTWFNALKYFSFNFDSAAGIIYTVDVRKRKGNRVNIISMADGTPFSLKKEYVVVVNSYRGNGGGELLTKGAGIPLHKLKQRIITSTDKDFRYYLINYIEKHERLNPQALNQWKFIPEEWVEGAAKRDYDILFKSE